MHYSNFTCLFNLVKYTLPREFFLEMTNHKIKYATQLEVQNTRERSADLLINANRYDQTMISTKRDLRPN